MFLILVINTLCESGSFSPEIFLGINNIYKKILSPNHQPAGHHWRALSSNFKIRIQEGVLPINQIENLESYKTIGFRAKHTLKGRCGERPLVDTQTPISVVKPV